MPELPEVETVRRGLERTVVGKTIASVDVRVPKIFDVDVVTIDQQLVGATIMGAERRAKVLLVRLSNNWTLAIHLKMTGQLVFQSSDVASSQVAKDFAGGHPEKAYEQPLPHKHTHIIIQFTDGTTLYFNDLRKFGWMRLVASSEVASSKGINLDNYGPEPLSDEFTFDGFRSALAKRRIPIKTVLLDQKVVAGVGNIYADEALFRAKIRPTRKTSALKPDEIERLFKAIPEVLKLGIDYGGTTFNAYRNVEGTKGAMREHLKVYGREGLPCTVCNTPIERIKLGQRSTHFCPRCQR